MAVLFNSCAIQALLVYITWPINNSSPIVMIDAKTFSICCLLTLNLVQGNTNHGKGFAVGKFIGLISSAGVITAVAKCYHRQFIGRVNDVEIKQTQGSNLRR